MNFIKKSLNRGFFILAAFKFRNLLVVWNLEKNRKILAQFLQKYPKKDWHGV